MKKLILTSVAIEKIKKIQSLETNKRILIYMFYINYIMVSYLLQLSLIDFLKNNTFKMSPGMESNRNIVWSH